MEDQTSLANARREIDRIDAGISRLLEERFHQVEVIAEWKQAHGQPVFVPAREEEIIRKIRENTSGDFCADDMENIFRAIFAACRRREERLINGSKGK